MRSSPPPPPTVLRACRVDPYHWAASPTTQLTPKRVSRCSDRTTDYSAEETAPTRSFGIPVARPAWAFLRRAGGSQPAAPELRALRAARPPRSPDDHDLIDISPANSAACARSRAAKMQVSTALRLFFLLISGLGVRFPRGALTRQYTRRAALRGRRAPADSRRGVRSPPGRSSPCCSDDRASGVVTPVTRPEQAGSPVVRVRLPGT